MRKITVGAQVSLDGVMQAPGGPWEDPTKGFTFGGWVMPYFDEVFGEEIDRVLKENCDLLLGRKTYEIFAGYWPYYDETASAGRIAKLFKRIKKYLVSRSGDVDTSWQGSVLLRASPTWSVCGKKMARTSSLRAAPNWCTRCSPTTSLTQSASSLSRSSSAAARGCSRTALRRTASA